MNPIPPFVEDRADIEATASAAMTQFRRATVLGGTQAGLDALRAALQSAPATAWEASARQLVAQGAAATAVALLRAMPASLAAQPVLRVALGEALWQAGAAGEAEAVLRRVLAEDPRHYPAALALARQLRNRGRLDAAVAALAAACGQGADLAVLLECALFMKQCQREAPALALCEGALARGERDARLFALAGNLALALGRFEQARTWLLEAIAQGVDFNEWQVPEALARAQRYRDPQHPDFARFEDWRNDPRLGPRARASLLFGLAKAYDDVGDCARAATLLREANAVARSLSPWSREGWQAVIAAQLAAPTPRVTASVACDCTPVFVVGLPRTGTTLVAELLGRHPDVRNRGELPMLGYIASRLRQSGHAQDPIALRDAAELYLAHLRQDDAPARWYVDKDPLNFRYLDTVAALFPQARVVYCRRDRRDTALSIWSQMFGNPEYGFACDFADIALVAADCERLMAHWQRKLPLAIHVLDYEHLAAQPQEALDALGAFVGLPTFDLLAAPAPEGKAIASASLWQARQPVHRGSIGRWQRYVPYLPELTAAFPG